MRNNFGYKLLALFLSVLLWLYVTNQQNPLSEATYSVPLDVKNLPTKLVVAEKLPSATIRLMGRKHLLEKTTTKDIKAYLNLQKAKEGDNKIDVSVEVPKDIQVVSVTPLKGDITLTTISAKQVTLKINTLNPPPEGYLPIAQQLTPTQVVISGPKNILHKVAKAVVEVDLGEQKANYLQRLPIRIYDTEGNDLSDWLKIKPEVAEAFIAISTPQPRKQLAIKPVFKGPLSENKKISRVVINPELVTITGAQEVLNNLYVVETLPIDLTGKTESFTTEAFLSLPEGVAAYPVPKAKIEIDLVNK